MLPDLLPQNLNSTLAIFDTSHELNIHKHGPAALIMVAYDSRVPLRIEKFKAGFPLLRTSSYVETPPGSRTAPSTLRTLAWAPLGNLVATGSVDRKLRVWNPERPNVKHSTELRGHSSAVERVVWNPLRESELASCSADGTVRIWDARTKANVAEIKASKEFFTLAWRPNGEELIAGTKDDTLFKISRATNSVVSTHPQPIQTNHIMYSWSGNELFLTGGDGTIKILDSDSMDILYNFRAHTSSCFSLDYSPDGRYLAVGGTDALITLWDTSEWLCQRSIDSMTGPIRTVSFSWDAGYITAGGEDDKGLEIFHVETAESVHKIDCGAAPVVQWSPRDHSLAYALHESAGGGLRIINAASLEKSV